MRSHLILLLCFVAATAFADTNRIALLTKMIEKNPEGLRYYQSRGEAYFRENRFEESVADFDKVIELEPRQEPYHWQRGISLYYADRPGDGAKQFESHKSVNPNDVENAVWHFLCVAEAENIEAARKKLIPIKGDGRIPMMTIHALFAEEKTPEDVLKVAEEKPKGEGQKLHAMFYAHLYLGLYYRALNDAEKEKHHIKLSVTTYDVPNYMGDVARAHAKVLKLK